METKPNPTTSGAPVLLEQPPRIQPAQVARLRDEHANIAQLLLALDSHFVRLHEDGSADQALLLNAVSYILEYMDRHHHTREELVVDLLATREPLVRALLATLSKQSEALHALGAELRAGLGRDVAKAEVVRRALARQGLAFGSVLRRNIALEEAVIFPIATLELSADEWAAIDDEMAESVEVVLGRDDEHFRGLFEELMQRFDCDCTYA